MPRLLLIFIGACFLAGCAGERVRGVDSAGERTNELRFVFLLEGSRTPMLSTNEVMELAWDRARRYRRDITNYFCDYMCFGGDTTNRSLSNRWVLHFRQRENRVELHSDFFVDVEDSTRAVELIHH